MDCSLTCNLFEKCSTFLQWAVEFKTGLHSIDHYLDNFIFMGREHSDVCSRLMENFMDLSKELGIPIAEEKTVGPTKVLSFLGYVLDTELMMVFIPQDKLAKLHSLLIPMLHKQKMLVRQLESVIGLLAFCARAITASRAFIRRFYDLIAGVKNKPHYKVRLNNEIKSDVLLLLEFVDKFNGHYYFPDRTWVTCDSLQLFSDASGNPLLGAATYFCGRWSQFHWPFNVRNSP